MPELEPGDFSPWYSGVRAQAVGRDGRLVDDFVMSETERALHVRNAPSPAATSSLALARLIADRAEDATRLACSPCASLETRLDGPILIEPDGPRRRSRLLPRDRAREHARRARHHRRLRPGQPVALGARRAARHALPARHGEARALRARARSSTWSWTSAPGRRASGAGRRSSSTTRTTASSTARTASRTASACSPTRRTWSTAARAYYDPAREARLPLRRPRGRDRVARRSSSRTRSATRAAPLLRELDLSGRSP